MVVIILVLRLIETTGDSNIAAGTSALRRGRALSIFSGKKTPKPHEFVFRCSLLAKWLWHRNIVIGMDPVNYLSVRYLRHTLLHYSFTAQEKAE